MVLCLCELWVWIICVDDSSSASEVHQVFNSFAPYGYLLSNMHLFIEDIANPDSFV